MNKVCSSSGQLSRRLSLFILTSIDGKIARSDGSIDWIHTTPAEGPNGDFHYSTFFNSLSSIVSGRKTFEVSASLEELPFPGKSKYVFTRKSTLPQSPNTETTFVNTDLIEFVKKLKSGLVAGDDEGSRIWLLGGGEITRQLHDAGLIDELILTIQPIILGPGISLFEGLLKESHWTLKSSESWTNGLVQLTYERS